MTTSLTGTSGSVASTLTVPVNTETADASVMATNVWQVLLNSDTTLARALDNDNVIAHVSGSSFTKLTGSLQCLSGGSAYLRAAPGVTVVTGSSGQITVGINNNLVATISGSTFAKLSGSLQCLSDGSAYMRAAPGVSVITGSSGQVTVGVNDNVVATLSGSTFSGPITGSKGLDCGGSRLANFCNKLSAVATTTGGYAVDTLDTYTPPMTSGSNGVVGCRFATLDALSNPSSAGMCDAKLYVHCPAAGDLRQIGTPVYDNALPSGSVPVLSCSAGSVIAKLSTYDASSKARVEWYFNKPMTFA